MALLWPVVRDFPAEAIREWAGGFEFPAVAALVIFESAAWILMGERWRYFCRENGVRIGLIEATSARLAGFAWSYITPGPQIGGEPIQILYISHRGHPARRVLPALVRDRSYEFFSGLITASLLMALPSGDGRAGWISGAVAITFITGVAVLSTNYRVFRCVAGIVMTWFGRTFSRGRAIHRFLSDVFRNRAARKRSIGLQALIWLSLVLAPVLAIGELFVFFGFSGMPLNWRSALVLAAASRISRYAPVPGAIGVYDAGMMATVGWLGLDTGAAAGYILFTRIRDLIQVGFGLALSSMPQRGDNGR